ncbi:MAG: heavy-metal-associated domain-containing protein [Marinibacterium sp.]
MKFSVPDMSCGHCTAAIEKAVKELDPTAEVACDLDNRQVTIGTDLSDGDIAAALAQAGYASQPVAA